MKKTIFIATSKPGRAVGNYFLELAKCLKANGNNVVMLIDGKSNINEIIEGVEGVNDIDFYDWPSKRPTHLKDFLFLYHCCPVKNPGQV